MTQRSSAVHVAIVSIALMLMMALVVMGVVRKGGRPLKGSGGPREGLVPWRANVLVLDLDETLVHAVINNGNGADMEVFLRPDVHEFLEGVSRAFREIVVFTAATKPYADQVLDALDPDGRIVSRRFYRDSCTMLRDGAGGISVAKDLRLLGVDLASIVLLDNTPSCYSLQPDNGIPIKSWVGDKGEGELLRLLPFLVDEVAPAKDVRAVVRSHYHQNR
jgi:CTD small phosphatase-like protein 2